MRKPRFATALSVNQARLSCSAVQGEVPLLIVPSAQIVLSHITSFRFASVRCASVRSAEPRYMLFMSVLAKGDIGVRSRALRKIESFIALYFLEALSSQEEIYTPQVGV